MKVIVVLFFICALIVLSQELRFNIKFNKRKEESEMQEYKLCLNKKYKNACIKESGITPNCTKLLERNELTKENMNMTDICYFTCMLKENHIMEENGKINKTRITRAMPEKIANKVKKFIKHFTTVYNFGRKNDCFHQGNMFLNIISMLETSKFIKITIIYKGTEDESTNVYQKYQSCGTW